MRPTRSMRRALLLAAVAAAFFLETSCSPSRESAPRLDPTPPLSGGAGWAVVKGAYVRLKERPSRASADLAHLRGGECFELSGRSLGDSGLQEDAGQWYRLKVEPLEGWVEAADLQVFASKTQAERAAKGAR